MYDRFLFRTALIAVALVPAGTTAAGAQTVSGANAYITDVTGPPITTADLLAGVLIGEPGTVQTFFCSAATGVRNAVLSTSTELASGRLPLPTVQYFSAPPFSSVQPRFLELLNRGEARGEVADEFVAALTPAWNANATTRREARRLVERLEGLFRAARDMDPERPGNVTATTLTQVVGHFNAFVNASSEPFLASPPEEFLLVQAVISRLVIGAMDYENRPQACAAMVQVALPPLPPPTEPPPPPPPAERAASICTVLDGELREIAAIVIPSTGDTLVVVDGERRPFDEIHPPVGYARDATWFEADEPLDILGHRYLRFGPPRVVSPGDVSRAGEHHGVPVFKNAGGPTPPDVLFVPVRVGCVVQPYQRETEVRRIRG